MDFIDKLFRHFACARTETVHCAAAHGHDGHCARGRRAASGGLNRLAVTERRQRTHHFGQPVASSR